MSCPLPVLMARKALRDVPAGAVIELRANDPLTRIDIPHFCAQQGHALLDMRQDDGILIFRLRKAAG